MSAKAKRIRILFLIILVLLIIFPTIYFVYLYATIDFSFDERLFENSRKWNSTIFYADNDSGEEYEPVEIETSGAIRKNHYNIDEISSYLTDGFVAVEDKIFYEHSGVDIKRTVMAAWNYLFGKGKKFGASTITQQVIKNISGDNKPRISRKIAEIIRAVHVEQKYSKSEILEVYLNIVPMSENIYGVGAAAKAYFNKQPWELTSAEAATLIGLTNAPSAYNPYSHPEKCIRKRNIVLSVMYNDGLISQEEYSKACDSPLGVISREERKDRLDSWFVETAIEDVVRDLTDKYNISSTAARIMLLSGGYKVYTTMNIDVQKILDKYFENPENFTDEINYGLNYAMVVTDSVTGDLVGIIGNVGKKQANRIFNHATAPHQPASALKPLALYAPLIDEGLINWATVFDDVPVSFIETDDGYREYPRNSPDVYAGLTPIKDALRLSKNTVAVRLSKLRGIRNIFDSLRNDFRFDTLVEKDGGLTDVATAPMALGQMCQGISILKLTEGYSTLVGDGIRSKARSYISLVDYTGETVLTNEPDRTRIFKPETARIMNQLLMTVTDSGTAESITLKKYVETAGKTGTSSGNYDKIFVGYTPYYTAGIWCGYSSSKAVPAPAGHLRVWNDVMIDIHREIADSGKQKCFSKDGLLRLPYCIDSGERFSSVCIYDPRGSRMDYGYFTSDNQPTKECTRHIKCQYDCLTKGMACDHCPKENLVTVSLILAPDRSFPKEIYVTDAEFVYRDVNNYTKRPDDENLPYFYYELKDEEFVGITKGKKQFNRSCKNHIK